MFRMSFGLSCVCLLSLTIAACGEDSGGGGDAAMTMESDGGVGVGRGRGGGGIDETDAASATDAVSGVDATPDALGNLDSSPPPKPDAALACNMTTCDAINTRYEKAVAEAKGCRSTAVPQCTFKIKSSLDCGGCVVAVNSDANLKPIIQEWEAAGCETCRYKCAAIACLATGPGFCQKNVAPAFATIANPVPVAPPIALPPIIVIPVNDGKCTSKSILQPL